MFYIAEATVAYRSFPAPPSNDGIAGSSSGCHQESRQTPKSLLSLLAGCPSTRAQHTASKIKIGFSLGRGIGGERRSTCTCSLLSHPLRPAAGCETPPVGSPSCLMKPRADVRVSREQEE